MVVGETCTALSSKISLDEAENTDRYTQVMPWDPDADVQITEADMYFLFAYYNKSKYFYRPDGIPEGRTYLLEINPYFKYRELDDQLNFIDARWIDMSTGLYIDITAARYAVNHPEGEGVLYDKHGHQYRVSAQSLSNGEICRLIVRNRIHTYTRSGRAHSRACRS